jgi:hypothetical protein
VNEPIFDASVGAPLVAASCQHRTMIKAKSTKNGLVGSSIMAAYVEIPRASMLDTKLSLANYNGTTIVSAVFYYGTMPDTNSLLEGLVGALLMAADLFLCSLRSVV